MIEEYKPVLKNPNFLYLWSSQILSQLTINIMNFVLLIRLFEKTGSTIATSLLWVAYALPVIFIGPFASASVDLVDRRKMLIVTNFLQAATIFFYALSNRTSFFLLYGIVLIYSFINQFYIPAEAAALPSVLPKKNLPQGNSLFFITLQTALIVGFGVAGFLNHLLGFDMTLYICSSLAFLAFVSTLLLPELKTEGSIPKDFEQGVSKFFGTIIEGYRFIKNERSILAPLVLLTGIQASLAVVTVNIPVLATDILNIDINSAGIYIVVPAAVGAAIGAAIIPKLIKRGWRKKRMIETSLMLTTFLLLVLTFIFSEFRSFLRPAIGSFVVLLFGLAFVGITVPSQTYLQEATPGELRGRVFGNFWFLITIAAIFPTIFSGTITELFGIRFLLVVLGGFSLGALIFSKKYGNKFITVNSKNG